MKAVTVDLQAWPGTSPIQRRLAMKRTCRSTVVCMAVATLGTLAAQGAKSKSTAPVNRREESHGTSW